MDFTSVLISPLLYLFSIYYEDMNDEDYLSEGTDVGCDHQRKLSQILEIYNMATKDTLCALHAFYAICIVHVIYTIYSNTRQGKVRV